MFFLMFPFLSTEKNESAHPLRGFESSLCGIDWAGAGREYGALKNIGNGAKGDLYVRGVPNAVLITAVSDYNYVLELVWQESLIFITVSLHLVRIEPSLPLWAASM